MNLHYGRIIPQLPLYTPGLTKWHDFIIIDHMKDLHKIVTKKRLGCNILGIISFVLISVQIVFVVLIMYNRVQI